MTFTKCKPQNLPPKLRSDAYFCLWKYETVNGRDNCKVPYNPLTKEKAQANNPLTFSDVLTAEQIPGFDGLGVGMFGDIGAIDIDHCIDENGQLSDMAADIVKVMNSYTEKSPSGTGLRILFTCSGLHYDDERYYIKNSKRGLEIYISGMTSRYVTVTGDRLNDYDLEPRTDEVNRVIEKYMQRPQLAAEEPRAAGGALSLTDNELIQKASNARNGSMFAELWAGDFSGYPSQSEADQALCNQLAFWTGGDASRIDELFRQSGLYRQKWERVKYREQTIKNAIASCKEFYAPREPQAHTAPATASQGDNRRMERETAAESEKTPVQEEKRNSIELFDLFMQKIQTEAYKPIKSGMPALDALLGGGFDPQSLVMIGAAPGMGKTSLCQQIFETMAAAGTEVIFFNLEMSREQLLARSISRATRKSNIIVSAADVMRGYKWTEPQREAIQKAAADYKRDIAPHMQYNPDGTGATLTEIKTALDDALNKAKQENKPAPVVVLDYLQLIQAEAKQDPQEAIKATVKALKDYAIQGQTIACAILAFNRNSNAAGKVTLESGRDTSAIEYSADTLLGLNYSAIEEGSKNISQLDELQQEKPRQLVLKLLKKRMTDAGGKLELAFEGQSNCFIPIDKKHNPFGSKFTAMTDATPDNPFTT